MSGHPLPGHRWSHTTRTFSDPAIEEQEGLLRNAAPDLAAVLIEYESIEAEIILDDKCWNGETLPQHYHDRLVELQHKRNAALTKAGLGFEARAKAKEDKA